MSSLVLDGVHLFDPGSGLDRPRATVTIAGGCVAAIDAPPPPGARVIAGRGRLLVPGLVDLRAQVPEPGATKRETLRTAMGAAAAGGYTTIVTMPSTDPPLDRVEIVEAVLARSRVSAGAVRVWPAGALTLGREGQRLSPMGLLLEAGCVLFTDADRVVRDAQLLRYALEAATDLGVTVMTHPEDVSLGPGAVMHEGLVSARLGLRGAPFAAEAIGVARDLALAELTNARLHLAHVSTAASVALLREAKARGLKVSADASPFHLVLTDEALAGYDSAAKLWPPLRPAADVEAVIRGLADGTIDAIASDHTPLTALEKNVELEHASPGAISLESTLGVVLGLVRERRLTLERAIALCTRGPADVLGAAAPVKVGRIRVGEPADLTLVDLDEEWVYTAAGVRSLAKNSPLFGRRFVGRVKLTIVDGQIAFDETGES